MLADSFIKRSSLLFGLTYTLDEEGISQRCTFKKLELVVDLERHHVYLNYIFESGTVTSYKRFNLQDLKDTCNLTEILFYNLPTKLFPNRANIPGSTDSLEYINGNVYLHSQGNFYCSDPAYEVGMNMNTYQVEVQPTAVNTSGDKIAHETAILLVAKCLGQVKSPIQ